jgi:chromobox protein 1
MASIENSAEELFDVEAVVNTRVVKGKRQFLIKWVGYPDSENTWEDEDNLMCDDLVQKYFEDKKTQKTKPAKSKVSDVEIVSKMPKTDKIETNTINTEKEQLKPLFEMVPPITNLWHQDILKVTGASLDPDGTLQIEYVLKNGKLCTSPSEEMKFKAPLKLIEFYAENLSFPE